MCIRDRGMLEVFHPSVQQFVMSPIKFPSASLQKTLLGYRADSINNYVFNIYIIVILPLVNIFELFSLKLPVLTIF